MLLRKDLPSAKDARVYLSVERVFLGYIKLSLYSLSLAILLDKLQIISDLTQKIHLHFQMHYIILVSSLFSILILLVGMVIFYSDVKYLEGGLEVAPKETTDPRIYMASERTMLAWVRTAIALIVFGFVIEKFEFFLLQLEQIFNIHTKSEHKGLFGVGILIIILGLITLTIGVLNFYSTVKKVDTGYYRTNIKLYITYGFIILLVCLILTAYILRIV